MYKFKKVKLKNGIEKLLIEFEDKSKEVLSTFLEFEIDDFGDIIVPLIDKVLHNKSEFEEFNGNAVGIRISEDKSHIYSLFDFEDNEENCIIETKELRNLIDIWLKKLDEFDKTGEV